MLCPKGHSNGWGPWCCLSCGLSSLSFSRSIRRASVESSLPPLSHRRWPTCLGYGCSSCCCLMRSLLVKARANTPERTSTIPTINGRSQKGGLQSCGCLADRVKVGQGLCPNYRREVATKSRSNQVKWSGADGVEWSVKEWGGAERSGVEWSGVEWSGVESKAPV